MAAIQENVLTCAHCGDDCTDSSAQPGTAVFCCTGCKTVYQLLNQQGLCDYYALNKQPGTPQRTPVRKDKFAFLDDDAIGQQLISFRNDEQTRVSFYLPHMHCSSCLYLLENLRKLQGGILFSRVDFAQKEVAIGFDHRQISLRQVAELLTQTGYEPYISLAALKEPKPGFQRSLIYRLGVAGFCFANIMLLSFPEYLGLEKAEQSLQGVFRLLNFILSLPVLLYSAQPFYQSARKGLQQGFLHIDAPVALAIWITFGRSVWEVWTGTGAGYFDSMTGIVFFMLAGKVMQDKTHRQLSFERDYTSWFPVAVTVLKEGQEIPVALPGLQPGDTLLIHHEELIPADGILTRGKALIDYSFVTGESMPVVKEMGEMVYAGGRQKGANVEILVTRGVAQSYLTQLWNQGAPDKNKGGDRHSFIHLLSKYFTWMVFMIAAITALYWYVYDTARIWNAVTAILIIACPCALLLSGSFTNGHILRILGRNQFYLRDAQTIEGIAGIDHIVFDKTGTLTAVHETDIAFEGEQLSQRQEQTIRALAAQSRHPLTRALAGWLPKQGSLTVQSFREIPGQGIEGMVDGLFLQLGSAVFVKGSLERQGPGTRVYVKWDGHPAGCFVFTNHYRADLPALTGRLQPHYHLSLISGDNNSEEYKLRELLGYQTPLLFHQQPADKLQYIQALQAAGKRVMMVGDGLNDAGALQQSDAGIALAEDTNAFTPASDAILDARQLGKLDKFILLCKANRTIIMGCFLLSLLYNLVGLYFAVQGQLQPMIAAILMPSSSLSILLISYGSSQLTAWKLEL